MLITICLQKMCACICINTYRSIFLYLIASLFSMYHEAVTSGYIEGTNPDIKMSSCIKSYKISM